MEDDFFQNNKTITKIKVSPDYMTFLKGLKKLIMRSTLFIMTTFIFIHTSYCIFVSFAK